MSATIMLHVCCAPCATHCVRSLENDGYAVTLCFANDNIVPEAEYRRRLDAARTLANRLEVPLRESPCDHHAWRTAIAGHERQPEGGTRCGLCFSHNLLKVSRLAKAAGIERFTTSLTVSPHKSSRQVFAAGRLLAGFKAFDFKKREGFRKSLELSAAWGLYRQRDCGCEFSRRNDVTESAGVRTPRNADASDV